MGKALRWVGFGVAGLGVLLLIAVGVIVFLLARLDMRAEIETAVQRATGRELTIAGDVGFTFWPVLGFSAGDASLANVEGGRAEALAAIGELNVGVEIAPLFRRQVEVRSIVLERPRIALEVDREGRPNWTFEPQQQAPGPEIDIGEAPEFSLREVRIVDGEVSFFDARRNDGWAIADVDLKSALTSLDEPVRVEGQLDYREQRIELELEVGAPRAAMRGQGTPVKASLQTPLLEASFEGEAAAAAGEVSGVVSANGSSVKRLSAWLGAPMEGVRGFGRFTVTGNFRTGGGQIAFENAGFTLDALAGRGDFVLMTVRAKPYVSGRIEIFDFDLNPYLAQAPQSDAPAAAAAAASAAPARALDVEQAASETPIDFGGLRAINCDLEITAGALKVQRMTLGRTMLGLVLNDGFLAATLHQITLYGGTGTGRVEIDAREAVTRVRQELDVQNVDANAFLTDAINLANLEGRAQVTLGLSAQGRTQSELIRSADGRVHLEVVSGAIRGVDLGGVARTIRNALSGDLVQPNARTPFHGFSADFAIADGVLASDSLSFNTPDLRITGIGVIDTPARGLDIRLAPRSQGGGIVIPFAIRGDWDALNYTSDISDRALREIRARVDAVEAAN